MPDLEDTIILAANAHRGQTDKAGDPYICHPIRLMLSLKGDDARMVALLHDVVEDTDVTLEQLAQAQYPDTVVAAVEALTHRDEEPYFDYVERLRQNPLARSVKLADLRDNMNLNRIPSPTQKDRDRLTKYQKALEMLGG